MPKESVTQLLELLKAQGGIAVALAIIAMLFYKLVWKVWDATLQGKQKEIDRVSQERDFWQGKFFENLQHTEWPRFLPKPSEIENAKVPRHTKNGDTKGKDT